MKKEDRSMELVKAFQVLCDKFDTCDECMARDVCDAINGDDMPLEWNGETILKFLGE